MPSRRAYLTSTAAVLAALAGCNESAAGPETDTSTSTQRTTTTQSTTTQSTTADPIAEPQELSWGEAASIEGTDVTPIEVSVQQSAFLLATADTMDVISFGDRQGVFVTVSVDGEAPVRPADFELSVGEDATGWTEYRDVRGERFYDQGQPYYADDRSTGWVGFDAPDDADADAPRLRLLFGEWNGAIRWPLPDEAAAALRSPPPEFAVTEFDAPETVSPDEPVTVSATVENLGEGPGTFRAAFNELGPMYRPHRVELALDPGESTSWEGVLDSHVGGDGGGTVRLDFRSPAGTYDREVEITDG